jgi:ubiquinone biosynthesis protein UbiJ
VRNIDDHFFIKRIREIRDQLPGPLAAQAEREAIALVEQSEALREENEKLKTYADVNWLKRELDALTARVAHLEKVERHYGK